MMTSNRPTGQDKTDERFEERLRQFRPVAPSGLTIPPYRSPWAGFAVAAVLLLAAGVSFVTHQRQFQRATVERTFASPPVTMAKLNAALCTNDEAFNRVLDDASPNILPRGQRGTVLYELGKE